MIIAVIASTKWSYWLELQHRDVMRSEAPACVLVHEVIIRRFISKRPDQFPFLMNSWNILLYHYRLGNNMILMSKLAHYFVLEHVLVR